MTDIIKDETTLSADWWRTVALLNREDLVARLASTTKLKDKYEISRDCTRKKLERTEEKLRKLEDPITYFVAFNTEQADLAAGRLCIEPRSRRFIVTGTSAGLQTVRGLSLSARNVYKVPGYRRGHYASQITQSLALAGADLYRAPWAPDPVLEAHESTDWSTAAYLQPNIGKSPDPPEFEIGDGAALSDAPDVIQVGPMTFTVRPPVTPTYDWMRDTDE